MSLMCCYRWKPASEEHSCTTTTRLLAIMQQTIFSVRKVEKNLDKLRFYWANMRKKAAPGNSKKGKQSFSFFPAFYLLL